MSRSGRSPQFATLESARELESKCVPQLFLGSLLGATPFSYWPIFSSSRSLCERQVNSAQFPSRRIPAGYNSQSGSDSKQRLSFHLALPRLFYFFSQYASHADGFNIRYASKQNLYKSKVRTIYDSGKQTITYTATITR